MCLHGSTVVSLGSHRQTTQSLSSSRFEEEIVAAVASLALAVAASVSVAIAVWS